MRKTILENSELEFLYFFKIYMALSSNVTSIAFDFFLSLFVMISGSKELPKINRPMLGINTNYMRFEIYMRFNIIRLKLLTLTSFQLGLSYLKYNFYS